LCGQHAGDAFIFVKNVIGKGGRNACCGDNGANQTHDEVRARDYYFAASENKHGCYMKVF
jgi:hypothetical protein